MKRTIRSGVGQAILQCAAIVSAATVVTTVIPAGAQAPADTGIAPTPTPAPIAMPAAVPTGSAPKTTIPSDANARRHGHWFKPCQENVASMKGKPVDIIFIGDSIVQHWNREGGAVWQKYYASRNSLNFGVGADKTQDVLWRLDTMDVKDFRPKVAVVLIGTNNVSDTPADIAAGIAAVVRKTEQTFPGVKVILVSILPTAKANDRMVQANTLIRPLADDRGVFYLDLAAQMTPEGRSWKGIGRDRVHPTAAGYEMWAASMEPLLARLLTAPPG